MLSVLQGPQAGVLWPGVTIDGAVLSPGTMTFTLRLPHEAPMRGHVVLAPHASGRGFRDTDVAVVMEAPVHRPGRLIAILAMYLRNLAETAEVSR